jgi:predicted ester cyclase
MSVEQVARDFIAKMNVENVAKSYLTPDAMAAGGVLPQPMPASEAFKMMGALNTAFPDLKFDIQNVTVKGNQATVQAIWRGTNKGPLNLPIPGLQSIPPTGKQVSVKDTYIVTVEGDKVSRLEVDSPPDGGVPGALGQIGVKVPGM